MKLKVKPEGREDIWLVEKEDLKVFIKSRKLEQIHNFVGGGFMVIGADHDIESVMGDIDKAERLAVLTGLSQAGKLGHALALIIDNKLEMYDIGELTESDLDILT